MNISNLLREIKKGRADVYCNNKRISYYNGRFWTSTIASEKSYSERGIRAYIKRNIESLEFAGEKRMSYREFLNNIDNYVGKVVEFTSRFKANGKTFKAERYVWDSNEFGETKEDSLIEVIEVKVIRNGNLNTSIKGVIGVK